MRISKRMAMEILKALLICVCALVIYVSIQILQS